MHGVTMKFILIVLDFILLLNYITFCKFVRAMLSLR